MFDPNEVVGCPGAGGRLSASTGSVVRSGVTATVGPMSLAEIAEDVLAVEIEAARRAGSLGSMARMFS